MAVTFFCQRLDDERFHRQLWFECCSTSVRCVHLSIFFWTLLDDIVRVLFLVFEVDLQRTSSWDDVSR